MAATRFLALWPFKNLTKRHLLQPPLTCSSLYKHLSSHQLYVDNFGEPQKSLKCRHVDLPEIGPREVGIKMMLAPINPSDINTIEGTYFVQPPLPAVMGNEGVGKVVEVGSEVRGLQLGDWVIPVDTMFGTWQTHCVAEETDIIKVRNDIPALSAATLSVNPCTAYRMLKDYVELMPGDFIMQNGSNSGVGVSVIQLAKIWGIKTINVVRNRPDIDDLTAYLKSLGADYVITEEFSRTPAMKDFMASLPNKPRLAFNCVGGQSASEILRHLGQGGTMVTYGGMSKKPVIAPTGALLFKEIKLFGYWNTNWNRLHKTDLKRFEMLSDLCNLIKRSKFVAPQCEFFDISDYEKALDKSISGFKGVKVVFKID